MGAHSTPRSRGGGDEPRGGLQNSGATTTTTSWPARWSSVTVECSERGTSSRTVLATLAAAPGLTTDTVTRVAGPRTRRAGRSRWRVPSAWPPDAPLTDAVLHAAPRRAGDLYDWSRADGQCARPPLRAARRYPGVDLAVELVASRYGCKWATARRRGARRSAPVSAVVDVPRVDVRIEPATEVVLTHPRIMPDRIASSVTLCTHWARDTTAGTVTIEVPRGWPPVIASTFSGPPRKRPGHLTAFDVRAPSTLPAEPVALTAVARDAAGLGLRGRRGDRGLAPRGRRR